MPGYVNVALKARQIKEAYYMDEKTKKMIDPDEIDEMEEEQVPESEAEELEETAFYRRKRSGGSSYDTRWRTFCIPEHGASFLISDVRSLSMLWRRR